MKRLFSQKGRAGFTLVELLVYIALVSLVVLLAGNVFQDALRFKVSTDRKLATYTGVNDILQVAEFDLHKVGLKTQKLPGQMPVIRNAVYMDTTPGSPDYSSFIHGDQGALDSLVYRSAVLNDSGRIIGVEQVKWRVHNGSLWRTRLMLPDSARDTLRIADDVGVFNIELGLYTGDSVNTEKRFRKPDSIKFAPMTGSPLVTYDSSNGTGIRGFSATQLGEVYLANGYLSGSAPLSYPMAPGMTYGVEITIGFNQRIRDNFAVDSNLIALTLRKLSGSSLVPVNGVGDFLIYAGGDYNANPRTYLVSHGEAAGFNAVPVLKFHLHPLASASDARAYITQVRIWEVARDTYDWRASIPTASKHLKARVKALRLTVRVDRGGESSSAVRVIPIPNNGV